MHTSLQFEWLIRLSWNRDADHGCCGPRVYRWHGRHRAGGWIWHLQVFWGTRNHVRWQIWNVYALRYIVVGGWDDLEQLAMGK